jgi:hypothetical protein
MLRSDDQSQVSIHSELPPSPPLPLPPIPQACAEKQPTHEIKPSRSAVVCQIRSVRKLLNALTMTFKTSGIWSTQTN